MNQTVNNYSNKLDNFLIIAWQR